MATDIDTRTTPDEIAVELRQAAKQLEAWAAHLDAYHTSGEPGSLFSAVRTASIVQAVTVAAACDTRALTRP